MCDATRLAVHDMLPFKAWEARDDEEAIAYFSQARALQCRCASSFLRTWDPQPQWKQAEVKKYPDAYSLSMPSHLARVLKEPW